jgi:hypothetical protein
MKQRRRTFTAWIAFVAILLHALMPLAQAAGSARTPAAGVASMALCSAHGMGMATMAQPTAGSALSAHSHHVPDSPGSTSFKCPLCLAGAHFALASQTGAPAFLGASRAHEPPATGVTPVFSATAWRKGAPRGPPLS